MGVSQISNFAITLAGYLKKDNTKKHAPKSFWILATARTAEAGISVSGLHKAGNWKSTKTSRERTKH